MLRMRSYCVTNVHAHQLKGARPDDCVIICNPALCFMLIVIGYVNVCKVQSF